MSSGSSSLLGFSFRGLTGKAKTEPETDSIGEHWPMKVDDFIQRDYLHYSDIVMTRKEWNFMSWLIRAATHGNFAHVALVFLQPNWQHGWQSTFLIESVFSGTEVTDMREYFTHSNLSIGVRRFNRPWFTPALAKRVRGRMLDDIKAEYSFSTLIGLGRQLLFGFEGAMRGHKRALARRHAAGLEGPQEYICSGFMQMGFVRGVMEFIRDGSVPPEAMRDVIFDKRLAEQLPSDWSRFSHEEQIELLAEFIAANEGQLMAVTPLDIETSGAFDWVFVVTKGLVHPVANYDEVCQLLRVKPLET